MRVHLILRKFGGVRQYHVLHLGWAVSRRQGKAPQGVTARPVLTDHRQDFVLDALAEGNLAVAHSDMSASLNNSLRGTLRGTTEGCEMKCEEYVRRLMQNQKWGYGK